MRQAPVETLLQDWKQLLSLWASSGALSHAAREALQLAGEPEPLQQLVARWSAGDFGDLPLIEGLLSASMPAAAGAYAISRRTIYLNADWLQRTSQERALAVLTEELGHHLDALLNRRDTPGDEGELFAALLPGEGVIREPEGLALRAEDDQGSARLEGREVQVEMAAVMTSTPIRASIPGRTSGEHRNLYAFAALKSDGSVVTWGDSRFGGDSNAVASQLRSGVIQIFSSRYAFAALKSDGSVVTWGDSSDGGDSSGVASQLRSGVEQIFSTGSAFAALKSDGSVVTWGSSYAGGESGQVASELSSGVAQVFSNDSAFTALKSNGSVVTWGFSGYGGDSNAVASQLRSGVEQIFSTEHAFAALKKDGSVVTWGESNYGGNSSSVASRLRSGVELIFSTEVAFAALKKDGSVVAWGNGSGGGDLYEYPASQIRSNVKQIFSNGSVFAALKQDGSVVTWGSINGSDTSNVKAQLSSGVSHVFSSAAAFAALKDYGSVVTWGASYAGGDSSSVASQLSSDVNQVFSNSLAFTALKSDGSIVSWGDSDNGGDSSAVASQLRSGVVAFANPFTDDRLILDPAPGSTYAIQLLSRSTGEEGTRLWFRVSRSGNTDAAGTVDIHTLNGSATSGSDFIPLRTRVNFKAGQTFRDVYVETLQDYAVESSERFTITLSKVNSSDSIGPASATGVIRNKPLAYVGFDPSGARFQVKDTPFDPTWAVRFRLNRETFNPALPSYVYVHGWKDSATSDNSQLMFSALSKARANVILVDWSGMAAIDSFLQPTKAVTATQQVGETVADFLIKTGLPLSAITLIGHSLGSLVAASAAREMQSRTGTTIAELVALDTAYGRDYDIDARTKQTEAPFNFNTGLATTTSSFTVSDLIGGIPSSAGDNERAATADKAYLVQYARSRNLPWISPDFIFTNAAEHAVGLHNGVIGVYADLFRKQALDPGSIPVRQTFNAAGKPDENGGFDGVVVAPMPWSYPQNQAPLRRAPRAMGWTNSYNTPSIYGSNADDVLFFDLFRDERDSAFLFGRGGNDWLIADQTDHQGIDVLTGGKGSDQFWFGYERYGSKVLPYRDADDHITGFGGKCYAIISDFNIGQQDTLKFGWPKARIGYQVGSRLSPELVRLYGRGIGFLDTQERDLIAYVPGMTLPQAAGLQASGRLAFEQFAPLDDALFFPSGHG